MMMTRLTKCQSDHWLRDCPQDDDLVTCGLSPIRPLDSAGQSMSITVKIFPSSLLLDKTMNTNEKESIFDPSR